MSKLYKEYVLRKIQNPNKIYLFKCGIFYVFIDADAQLMSNILGLKLIPLNSCILKCSFPVSASNKYFNILKNLDYDIEIVFLNKEISSLNINNYFINKNCHKAICDFLTINVESLSISQAFDLLYQLQSTFKELEKEINKNEKKE